MVHLIKENTQGPPLELALERMGIEVRQGCGVDQGSWEFVEETQLQCPFWSPSQKKAQHLGNLWSSSLPSPPSPFLTVLSHLTTPPPSPLCSFPLLFSFPISTPSPFLFFFSCGQAVPHGEMAPNQATSEDSTRFYFLFKILTTCLFLPLSNICLLKTSEK